MTGLATLAGWSGFAGVVLVLVPPVEGVHPVGAAAVPAGGLAGLVLFACLARRPVALAAGVRTEPRRLVARSLVLTARSAFEEAVHRGVVLTALVPLGGLPALAASSMLFAAAHARQGPRAIVHVLTGVTFGSVYLVTGALEAAIAAHAAYNVSIGATLLAGAYPCPFRPIDGSEDAS